MGKRSNSARFFEILPGATSWGIIILLILLAVFNPVACAICIIVFDFYWIIRSLYLTTLLVMAYHKLSQQKNKDWLNQCQGLNKDWRKFYHLVIFPVYQEGLAILKPSLQALADTNYPKENTIVVVAFEERNPQAKENSRILEENFKKLFRGYLSTFHPDGLPGEARTKGANATWAAKAAKEFILKKKSP